MKKLLYVAACAVLATGTAKADLLVSWDFGGSTTAPVSSNANFASALMLTTPVTRGSGLTVINNNDRFNAQSWTMPSGASASSAITSNDYFSITVQASVGATFSLTNLNLNIQRSNTGASNLFLRASHDGFASDLFTVTGIVGGDTTVPLSIGLSSVSGLQNTNTVEFRLYGYGASAANGSMGFEGAGADIRVFGTVVPEPSTVGMFLIGLGALTAVRRRMNHHA